MVKNIPGEDTFVAIVLAGDRTGQDPVALDAGVSCKAIVSICGRPMIMRVLDALQDSGVISSIILCGPPQSALSDCPQLAERIKKENITWIANLDSPSRSAEAALENINKDDLVLLTTADHALLGSEMVSFFASQSLKSKADANVGLIEYKTISETFPEVKRTVIKLRNGGFCGCNLYTFMNPKGRDLVPFWRRLEQSRKSPAIMIAGILGITGVLLYFMRSLSLDSAMAKVSRRLQLEIKPVILPFPQAGIDVDTVNDRQLVERILGN